MCRSTNRAQIAQPRPQPLAFHVDFCVLALHLEHHALETSAPTATRHARLDRPLRLRRWRACRSARTRSRS